MSVIRHDQMKAFSAALRKSFPLRLADHLHRRFPDRTAESFRQLAVASVKEARDLGFSTEDELTRFAEYAAIFGQPLALVSNPPWIAQTLHYPYVSSTEKLEILDNHYTFAWNRR